MFNARRFFGFIVRIVIRVLPIVLLLLALGVANELSFWGIELTQTWPACLRLATRCPPPSWWFWVDVLRDMIPGLLALVAALFLGARFVRTMYGLDSLKEGILFLTYSRFGRPFFSPYLLIQGGAVDPSRGSPVLRKIGGPGGLVIYRDSAVVLEREGRLTRVQGPSFPNLKPFEKVWDVIDLRPRHWVYNVSAMTKEGIPVTCEADVSFKIEDGGQEPSEERPFPMDEKAVFTAATCKWMREIERSPDDRELDWAGRLVIGDTEGNLRSILARYPLDRLIGPAPSEEEHPRRAIEQELERELRKAAPRLGAKILAVKLGDIKVDDKVTQQWIDGWQAGWEGWAAKRKAEGEAETEQLAQIAKAQAQAEIITAIADSLRSMTARGAVVPAHLIALRFIEVLRNAPFAPWTQTYLPPGVMDTLDRLEQRVREIGGREEVRQLGPGAGG
jgi:regulator of protease activity HflC (stomatin/prohibitin superfamily)